MNFLLLSVPNHQLLNVHLGGKLTLPPPVKIELFVVDLPPLPLLSGGGRCRRSKSVVKGRPRKQDPFPKKMKTTQARLSPQRQSSPQNSGERFRVKNLPSPCSLYYLPIAPPPLSSSSSHHRRQQSRRSGEWAPRNWLFGRSVGRLSDRDQPTPGKSFFSGSVRPFLRRMLNCLPGRRDWGLGRGERTGAENRPRKSGLGFNEAYNIK